MDPEGCLLGDPRSCHVDRINPHTSDGSQAITLSLPMLIPCLHLLKTAAVISLFTISASLSVLPPPLVPSSVMLQAMFPPAY